MLFKILVKYAERALLYKMGSYLEKIKSKIFAFNNSHNCLIIKIIIYYCLILFNIYSYCLIYIIIIICMNKYLKKTRDVDK